VLVLYGKLDMAHALCLLLRLLLLPQVKKVTLHDVRRMGEKALTVSTARPLCVISHFVCQLCFTSMQVAAAAEQLLTSVNRQQVCAGRFKGA
jgi:hypothetical protein